MIRLIICAKTQKGIDGLREEICSQAPDNVLIFPHNLTACDGKTQAHRIKQRAEIHNVDFIFVTQKWSEEYVQEYTSLKQDNPGKVFNNVAALVYTMNNSSTFKQEYSAIMVKEPNMKYLKVRVYDQTVVCDGTSEKDIKQVTDEVLLELVGEITAEINNLKKLGGDTLIVKTRIAELTATINRLDKEFTSRHAKT